MDIDLFTINSAQHITINFSINVQVATNGNKLKKGYLPQSIAALKKLINKKEGFRSIRIYRS